MIKKLPEPTRAAETLPSFLDSSADTDTTGVETLAETIDEPTDADGVAADDTVATDETAAVTEEPPAAESTPPAEESPRQRDRRPARPTGGSLALGLGLVALMGAPASLFVPTLATYGFTPNLLFVLGALLAAAGMTQRHVGRMQQRLDEAENRRRADATAVNQNLQLLVDDSQRDKVPAQGEELQQLMLQLQRQDEKINNLTKAIKMYGKPLMEISEQSTEVTSTLATVKHQVDGASDTTRKALEGLATQVRGAATGKDLADISAAVKQLAARVDSTAGTKSPTFSLEPLQQQLGRLEVSVAAIAQRLEDNEVRKSLLRLEEATQKGRDTLQELVKGDGIRQAADRLQNRVDTATKSLADGLAQLRDGNLGGLETAVRDIQREVTGVATTVAQINATVKNGLRPTNVAAPAAATPSPAAPAPAPTAAPAPATATPAPTTAAAPAAAAADAAGAAGYQTGTRTSGGKNVLGAIAKLKQMKS